MLLRFPEEWPARVISRDTLSLFDDGLREAVVIYVQAPGFRLRINGTGLMHHSLKTDCVISA